MNIAAVTTTADLIRTSLTIYLGAILPVLGPRGAVVVAAATGADWRIAFLMAALGSITATSLVLLVDRATLERLRRWRFFERVFWAADKLVEKRNAGRYPHIYFTLTAIVAIPMTGVGVLVACLAAKLLDLDYRRSLLAVSVGTVVYTLLVTAAVYGMLAGLQTILGAVFGF